MSEPRSSKSFIAFVAILLVAMTASICLAEKAHGIINATNSTARASGLTNGITNTPTAKSVLGSGPMVITSASMTANRAESTAVFEGGVVAKNNDVTIHADNMLVKYAEGGDVTSIESTGNVSFVTPNGAITSDTATYYAADKKLVFTGSPKAIQGASVVTGTEITYFIELEKYIVKNSKVLFEGKKK